MKANDTAVMIKKINVKINKYKNLAYHCSLKTRLRKHESIVNSKYNYNYNCPLNKNLKKQVEEEPMLNGY